MSTNLWSY